LNAAIAARERGARVVVADKGVIERSGDIGGGVDHFLAYLELEGDWDTREAFLEYVWRIGKGTGDPRIIDVVFCSELKEAIDRLERIGVPLKRPDGRFFRTKSMGQPGEAAASGPDGARGRRLRHPHGEGLRDRGQIHCHIHRQHQSPL